MVKAKRAKHKIIKEPILSIWWYIAINGTQEQALKWFSKKSKQANVRWKIEDNAIGIFAVSDLQQYDCLIWIDQSSGSSVIGHEIMHGIIHVAKLAEVNIFTQNEFLPCYAGWLMREIVNLYHKK